MKEASQFESLKTEVAKCRICEKHLALGPRPVIQIGQNAKILIVGQAPGSKVHASGIPWKDQSGDRLRLWLGVNEEQFYNPDNIAILPMGFCYPGKGKSGDLPPRKECAPQWHNILLQFMPKIELTLLIGQYAQKYYLAKQAKKNLTHNVIAFETFLPDYLPLPHPSPRNRAWFKNNPWFEEHLVSQLQERVISILK